MRKIFDELHKRAVSIAKDMDKGEDGKEEMFRLMQTFDYQLEQAVERIEKLETLIITKELENYSI